MRVGFAGTPGFAARALSAIHDAGHTIPVVVTRPDRPHGRGLKLAPSAVKDVAQALGLPLLQPGSLRSHDARSALLAVPADVLVVAAYGLILPPEVLAWPRHGCLNIHASILPRWRGAAPIARAIEAGDARSGITIMQMDEGLDTGPMVAVRAVALDPRETAGTLHDKLARAGAEAIVQALGMLEARGRLEATPQPAEGVTYAAKIGREEAALQWHEPAEVLDRRIRAFDPAPGAFARFAGDVVKIGAASPAELGIPPAPPSGTGTGAPGTGTPAPGAGRFAPGTVTAVTAAGIDVACGAGTVLRLATVKPAGGRLMPAAAFAAGRRIVPGVAFDPSPVPRA
jgi:methionyl-tRNA formyltransferase